MKDNVDTVEKGKLASAKGFANESRLLAALIERGYNASRVDLPHSTYDIVVEKSTHDLIRVQVKTVNRRNSVSFKGGQRAGADKIYKSQDKVYRYNTEKCDIVVGVESIATNGDSEINFYFIPALFIEILDQDSLSIKKIPQAKNDWDILLHCKEGDFVIEKFQELVAKKRGDLAAKQILLKLN